MASHKNSISQLHYWLFEVLRKPCSQNLPLQLHSREQWEYHSEVKKNSTLKAHDHEPGSYNKFKNFHLKITQVSPWQITSGHFFARSVIFVKHHLFWVSYLSISDGVLVKCHFCKVPLFSNGIKGCHFCWLYLMVVKL